MDGTFDFAEGIADALVAPEWSIEALRAVQGDLQRIQDIVADPTTPDSLVETIFTELETKLASHDDRLKAFIDNAVHDAFARNRKRRNALVAVITFLLYVVGSAVDLAEAGQLTKEHLWPLIKPIVRTYTSGR